MPNFNPTKLNRCTVTKGRRITLPVILEDINEYDQLVFAKTNDGYVFKKIEPTGVSGINKPQVKKALYAAVIGQHVGNGRWYGIILDANGLIKLRINSSSELYLRKDLTELPDVIKHRNKLNERCGTNQWLMPVLIKNDFELSTLFQRIIDTVKECEFGLSNGSWPPE